MYSLSCSPKPVIVVMVKAPRPGQVKTRLMPELTPEEAASLAAAFLRDTVRNALRCGPAVLIAYAPADGYPTLAALLPFPLQWVSQQGADLGERLEEVIAAAEALGFGPVVIVGTDSPTLPLSHLADALSTLEAGKAELVLGPTEDGGYYVVGVRRHVRGLFGNVAWSTSSACADTLANGQRLGLRTALLPAWYDIDTFDDLLRLRQDFKSDPGLAAHAPETFEWLQSHEFYPPPGSV